MFFRGRKPPVGWAAQQADVNQIHLQLENAEQMYVINQQGGTIGHWRDLAAPLHRWKVTIFFATGEATLQPVTGVSQVVACC